jgi:threonine dehydratase
MISSADVKEAATRIAHKVRRTPLIQLDPGTFAGEVWLKCEFMQHTGTFKARGAFNRILASHERGELDPDAGIVVASGGNAGLANAYAAQQLGVPASVYVPETAAGAGTVGSELLEQLGSVDTVVVAVGGGGLMAGVAAAVEGQAKVLAVEPYTAPTLSAAILAGEPVDVAVSGIAADSLGARRYFSPAPTSLPRGSGSPSFSMAPIQTPRLFNAPI